MNIIREKMKMLYCTGKYTHAEVAEKVGVKKSTAAQFYWMLKQLFDIPKPPRQKRALQASAINAGNIEAAFIMYKRGASLEKVGERFGEISRERVRQIFKKYGISSRPIGKCRIFTHCARGHKLGRKEYRNRCKVCIKESRWRRAKGLHLKTHCVHGHEYTKENTYKSKYAPGKYSRRCKKCHQALQARKWREKKVKRFL